MIEKISKYIFCIYLIVVLNMAGNYLSAQDVLFSQFYNTPSLTNPALIAVDTNIHVYLNLRQQRVSSGDNITTAILSGSYPIWKNRLSIGLSLFNDNIANFINTSGGSLSIAYRKRWANHHFSIGLQGGYFQKGLQLDNLITDNQLLTGTFDPNADLNDDFANNQAQYPLFSGGLFWYQKKGSTNIWKYFAGISFNNFNNPTFSFTDGGGVSAIPRNFTIHGGLLAFQNNFLSVQPSFRWFNRLNENIFSIGTNLEYYFQSNNSFLKEAAVSFGTWYQSNQLFTILLGYKKTKYELNLSYDLPLNEAQQSVASGGIFELTLKANLPKKYRPPRVDSSDYIPKDLMVKKDLEADTFLIEEKDKLSQIYYVSYENALGEDSVVIKVLWENSLREDLEFEEIEEKIDTLIIANSTVEFEYATIRFDWGDSTLQETALYLLEPVLIYMLRIDSTVNVEIIGHTCTHEAVGEEYELSVARAQMVKEYLIYQGVEADRITILGRGSFDPIRSNKTVLGREANRRVEISIKE